jgi:hypothetical protein
MMMSVLIWESLLVGMCMKGKTDEEKLDRVVGLVVKGLPGLQHLQLGDYKENDIPAQDMKWGKSARWIEIVKKRSESVELREEETSVEGLENEGDMRQCRRGSSRAQRGGRGGNWRGQENVRGRGNDRGGHGRSLVQ